MTPAEIDRVRAAQGRIERERGKARRKMGPVVPVVGEVGEIYPPAKYIHTPTPEFSPPPKVPVRGG